MAKKEKSTKPATKAASSTAGLNGTAKSTTNGAAQTMAMKPESAQSPPLGKIDLEVGPGNRAGSRLVIARSGEVEIHRDMLNTHKAEARQKFVGRIAECLGVGAETIQDLKGTMIEQADEVDANLEAQIANQADTGGEGSGNKSQATLIVELGNQLELFHTPDEQAFAVIDRGDHFETHTVKGRALTGWLRKCFHDKYHTVPNAQAILDAVSVLEGKALYDGPEQPVFTRVAVLGKAIYVFLGDPLWKCLKITAEGWKIVTRPNVRFQRPPRMLSLPLPLRGGSLDELWSFINVSVEDRALILAWLVQALSPTGPYPILCLYGQQGSAKSTTARALRALVDPSGAPLRAEPKNTHDLAIAAKGNWCMAFDNISYLPPDLSDAFCRLATGGGFGTRQLFTDDGEMIFDFQRPVILNGIEELVTRADLLERSIVVELPSISEESRRTEKEFWTAFESAKPRILGALLDAVVTALKELPSTTLANKPRLADFALWAHASESSWGNAAGKFLHAYQVNQDAAQKLPLESSPITEPLFKFLSKLSGTAKEWKGTATGLLTELEKLVDHTIKNRKTWPSNGQALSNRLRRLLPNLKAAGVLIEFAHSGNRAIRIQASGQFAEPSISSSATQKTKPGLAGEEPWQDDEDIDDGESDDTEANDGEGGDDGDDDGPSLESGDADDDDSEEEENETEEADVAQGGDGDGGVAPKKRTRKATRPPKHKTTQMEGGGGLCGSAEHFG